jgi:purine-cytosine permease-like protein
MYYLILIGTVLILNFLIYLLLKNKENFLVLLAYIIAIFFAILLITKLYDYFFVKNMPRSYSFFVLLSFSWGIAIMNLVKKIINKRVNVYKQLNLEEYFGEISFLKVETIFITLFQLSLIFTKVIFSIV